MSATNTHQQPARAAVLANLFAVYLIWGSTYLAIHFAVQGAPPFVMMAIRFLIAGGLLYTVLRLRGTARPTWQQWRSGAIIGALLLFGGNGMVAWAESQGVPSSLAALLVSMTPIWMTLIDWLRPHGLRPTWGIAVGLLLGFGGVALLVGPNVVQDLNSNSPAWGFLVIPFSSLAWAIGSIYARNATMPKSSLMGTSVEMLGGGLVLAIAALITGEVGQVNANIFTLTSTSALLYLILFGSLVGYSAYTWLLQNTPLSLASTYAYVNPVVAVGLGWALAHESLTPLTLVAAAIIVASVCLITTFRGHATTPVPEAVLAEEAQGTAPHLAE
ncbi:MAG: EamA family transporter [Ktedonobacterales bacterium]|nr:EamA family transporter [Ktedonobacterales bacterium]